MFLDGQHPLYPYSEEDKQGILKEHGLKESILQEDVDAILEWYYKQPHLSCAPINRDFIERMLVIAKGSREKTKRRIDNFYKYRSLAPELIQSRIKLLDGSTDMWTFYRQAALPIPFQGKRISVVKFCDPDPNNYSTEALFINTLLLGDLRLKYDYIFNDIWIIDFKNACFGHLLRTNPSIVQKSTQIFQDGTGIRVSAIHLMNSPPFIQNVSNFMKQFVKPKIMERVIIHDSISDLHKHIPRRYLPKDYGGDQPSLDDFKDKLEKEIRRGQTKQHLIDACQQISDESKRVGEKFHEEYLSGSFKKLDLD
ncbi:alpha-tocopherol transfer protein-like [Epargyreus clarus]|uniref:alpha-tocopherol transfer protein-like n=1 Tax=Epargyreus clarus TaxID=520877 RepID=UPI003C2F031D